MRILEEWQTFIHTHFQTDGQQLPTERVREIEQAALPLLRRLGIVFGIHLEREPGDPGIRIVLECRPSEENLEVIRRTLADTLRRIPRRPPVTVVRHAGGKVPPDVAPELESLSEPAEAETPPGRPRGPGSREPRGE